MVAVIDRWLNTRTTVYAACTISFALSLFFIFVWSPLPWGWHGIDFYYEIALSLAHGEPFSTMQRMWGYAYFLAFWYRLFGDHPWIPLVAQAIANAAVPLLLYHLVALEIGPRVAVMSALIVGLFSFNTVYTSIQASDALCTVSMLATMLAFAVGRARSRIGWFALAGLLAALAFQFRPNLILFPFFAGGLYLLAWPRTTAKLGHMAAFVGVFVLLLVPWIVRNYRWSGVFVPASTHGGVQLWFGTLQAGAYEDSWPYNPRAAFENPPVDYSSVDELPLVVTARTGCDGVLPQRLDMIYWTNRDRQPRRVDVPTRSDGTVLVTLPRQQSPTAVYYYFEAWWMRDGRDMISRTPPNGASVPRLFIVSRDHLSDLDLDGYMLDIFDVVRLMRHVAWMEPLDKTHSADRLDLDRDESVTDRDVRMAAALLVQPDRSIDRVDANAATFTYDAATAVLRFRDGSTLTVPRASTGKLTDIVPVGDTASAIVSRSRPFATVRATTTDRLPDPHETTACLAVDDPAINRVPYRRQPHEMRRFVALAVDNIKSAPSAYLIASARRALRLFLIEGSTDRKTATQFNRSGLVYAVGWVASSVAAALFVAGLIIGLKRRYRLFELLTPIVYVPLTICFMLINARYSMTVQPFVFAVIGVALVAALDVRSNSASAVGSTTMASGRK